MIACTVLVFAKAPVAGQVKTRLISEVGAEGAVALHKQLTLHAIDVAQQAYPGAVELWCAPDSRHAWFAKLARDRQLDLRDQSGADLGARMAYALDDALRRSRRALLIGTDIVVMSAEYLLAADRRLAGGADVVLGPAEDGGYVLIGLTGRQPQLFEGVDWGTNRVLMQTRDRIARLGLVVAELPALWDVDTPADLARLAQLRPEWAASNQFVCKNLGSSGALPVAAAFFKRSASEPALIGSGSTGGILSRVRYWLSRPDSPVRLRTRNKRSLLPGSRST